MRPTLGLGTAQFGLDYGISNSAGQVAPAEVAQILGLAAGSAISILDTAHLYGDSERVLGQTLPPGAAFRIVTKTPRFDEVPLREAHADLLEAAAALSLRRLGRNQVYGLLLHHSSDALADGSDRLFARLMRLKERGWVEKIGVSVYGPDELERILRRHAIDLVQLPFNVLDQRFLLRPRLIDVLRKRNIEVHLRSVFLQGLLLVGLRELNASFSPWLPLLTEFRRRVAAVGSTPLSVALRFALAAPFADAVIVGACSAGDLTGIISAAAEVTSIPELGDLAVTEESLINPSRWSLDRGSD